MNLALSILVVAAMALVTRCTQANAQPAAGASCGGRVTLVQAGQLMDVPGQPVKGASTLVVCNGLVQSVVAGHPSAAQLNLSQAEVVDWRRHFVLPGLIDSHVHLTSELNPQAQLQQVTQSDADKALRGAGNARKTLMAGFTTVADVGGANSAVFALRDGIKRGDVLGPRVLASGSSVSVHGGHGDINGFREDVMRTLSPQSVCSGADDCRRAVRMQVRAGADLIKITATGGVLSNTAAGLAQQFSGEELAAIVDTAHRMGRKVTAHAHGVDGVNAFLKAGGNAIEHGTYLNEESVRLFKANGAYLVPTLMAGDFVTQVARGPKNFLSPAQTTKALQVGPQMLDMARRAHAAGVKIAFGTDTGVSAHGDNAHEFVLLVQAGLTPLQAIQAATVHAADHLGLSAEVGSLEVGKVADLIAVDGDPAQDVARLKAVKAVMKSGRVVKSS